MATRIPRHFIDDLVARTDIVNIIDTRVPLKKTGINFMACCPFHEEKTASFSVSPSKQIYHCFGCGVSGNVINFLMTYENLDFVESIETLAAHAGLEIPRDQTFSREKKPSTDLYQLMQQVARYYQQQLKQTPEAIEYLKNRALSGEICRDFSIGYAPPHWDNIAKKFSHQRSELIATGVLIEKENRTYDRFRHRIMFPIRDRRGRVIGFGGRVLDDNLPKYLNSPETILFHKSKELYGLYEALQKNRKLTQIIIVEGYMDVIALAQHGITNCVATLGTATSKDHLHQLFRYCGDIIFCFDGDEAGKTAAWRALEISLSSIQDGRQIRFLFLPEGEDPDSIVRKEGKNVFLERLNQTQSLADFMFEKLSEKLVLSTIEGKSQLLNAALPLIEKLSSGGYQYMMLERLSRLTRMPIERLKEFMKDNAKNSAITFLQPTQRTFSAMRLAITLLLQNPQLIDTIEDITPFTELRLPGSHILQKLLQILKTNPRLSTGALLEYWREENHVEKLMELAYTEHHVPDTGLMAELQGSLQKLLSQQREQMIQALIQKAESLTEIERQELQMLIRANKTNL